MIPLKPDHSAWKQLGGRHPQCPKGVWIGAPLWWGELAVCPDKEGLSLLTQSVHPTYMDQMTYEPLIHSVILKD